MPWIVEFIGALGLAWALLFFNLFAQITAVEHYGYELFNQLFAPSSPGWQYLVYGYGRGAQDKILVVLLTDQDLQKTKSKAWPLFYADHAAVVAGILTGDPRALMIDFVFVDSRRGDDTVRTLRHELTKYEAAKIPVFLASPSTATSQPADILPQLRGTFARPVPVPGLGAGIEYALLTYTREKTKEATPAPAIYRKLCNDQLSEGNEQFCQPTDATSQIWRLGERDWTLDIFWGTTYPETPEYEACKEIPGLWGRFWAILWSHGDGFRVDSSCPFTRTVTVSTLLSKTPAQRKALIEGKVVFYGSNFVAGSDIIFPPTHYWLPGVYAHAMALDNLLTFGTNYKRDAIRSRPPSRLDDFIGRHSAPIPPFVQDRTQTFLRCFSDELTPHCVQYGLLFLVILYLALVSHPPAWLFYPSHFPSRRRWRARLLLLLVYASWYLTWYTLFYFAIPLVIVFFFTTKVQFGWLNLTAGNWLEALLEAWVGQHWGPRLAAFAWRLLKPRTPL